MHFFSNILDSYSWQGIALVVLLISLFFVQFYYYVVSYRRIHRFRLMHRNDKYCEKPYISVIVAVRGEDEYFLSNQLHKLLSQSYDVYEIVVVYIGRDVDYYAELQRIRDQRSNMKLTKMSGNGRIYITTKQAYNVGIKSAQYDNLLFTTPCAIPATDEWVTYMSYAFERGTIVAGAVAPRFKEDKLRTYLMRMTEFHYSRNHMAMAVNDRIYVAPRSNFGFTRKLYEATRGFNHLNMDIGENDLYIQSITSPRRSAVMLSPKSLVYEDRPSTWGDWLDIVRYNRSTAPYYPTSIGTFQRWEAGSRMLFFMVALAIMVILPLELKIVAAVVALLRYIMVLLSTRKSADKFGEKDILLKYWIYDLIGPVIDFVIGLKQSNNSPKAWI
ncbi:MAG: hypothetical protein J6U59_05455 [Alistipes sp.]|nr:hypothetical protein [Alistipes sp.]